MKQLFHYTQAEQRQHQLHLKLGLLGLSKLTLPVFQPGSRLHIATTAHYYQPSLLFRSNVEDIFVLVLLQWISFRRNVQKKIRLKKNKTKRKEFAKARAKVRRYIRMTDTRPELHESCTENRIVCIEVYFIQPTDGSAHGIYKEQA